MSCQRVLQVEKSCFGVTAEMGQHFILSGEQHQATHTGNKVRPTRLLSKKPQTLLVFLSINNLQYLQAVTLPWVSAQGGAGGALSACPPFAYVFFFSFICFQVSGPSWPHFTFNQNWVKHNQNKVLHCLLLKQGYPNNHLTPSATTGAPTWTEGMSQAITRPSLDGNCP